MNASLRKPALLAITVATCLTLAAPASARVTFYENDNYQGRSFSTNRAVVSFLDQGFNDRASSIVVTDSRWEVCDDVRYGGACRVLRQGNYPSLRAMGMNDRVSSVRPVRANASVAENRYAPAAPVPSEWRRRRGEQLFEVELSDVRAIVGPTEQRCWMERQDVVSENRPRNNVPGALLGAVLGGVIGHQIGGGTGRDIATVGGAVAGGVVGSRVGADGRSVETRDVQRCKTVPAQGSADQWDVGYSFRGQQHRAQLAQAPGRTILVNGRGEPRD